jgi:hypothetical protein
MKISPAVFRQNKINVAAIPYNLADKTSPNEHQ